MSSYLEKIKKEEFDFLKANSTIVSNAKTNKNFMFMPFWFEVISEEDCIVVRHSLDEEPPEELRDEIVNQLK